MKRIQFFFRKLGINRKKPFLFGLLILLCLGVSVGYAFLTTTLNINGAVNVASSRWDVHFENIEVKDGSVTATTAPTITDDTSISFAATLENPGDFYEFTVDVVNDGTYDAMIDSMDFTPNLTAEQKEYFDYQVTYKGGAVISEKELLAKGTSKTYKVFVQYKKNEDDSKYPGEDVDFHFSADFNFVQADSTAKHYVGNTPCPYDGELINGAVYTNGQYTYTYDVYNEGWNVTLTDKNSTDPVTSTLCSSVGYYPIVSMAYMFQRSNATSIDFSSFDTSNVTDMGSMFQRSKTTSLDLSHFDTSKVTYMSGMFASSQATSLDLSSFDTSNVTNMSSMFASSQITNLDLSSFNTSNVTNMSSMFASSQITNLDLSSFNTSNVTNMYSMFTSSKISSLDLSHFDTSNVTDFQYIFYNSKATTINISNWNFNKCKDMSGLFNSTSATTIIMNNINTSEVTNMEGMFHNSMVETIDLSHLNVEKVTTFGSIFKGSNASIINLSNLKFNANALFTEAFVNSSATTVILDNVDTSAVKNMSYMFQDCKASSLDLSSFDTSNVTTMDYMFYNAQATTGYARTQADADRFNASGNKPSELTFTVKS